MLLKPDVWQKEMMENNDFNLDNIRLVLWDVDGTILNFFEAQKNAIRACFERFKLGECSDEMLLDYDGINHKYWQALERNEITKAQVLTGRFYEFFEKYGIRTDTVEAFNEEYQVRLGDTICYFPGVKELILRIRDKGLVQFAVTNGTKVAQDRKLSASGLDKIFDRIFISEDVGSEKPNKEFFDPVYKKAEEMLPGIKLSEIVIIGDSPTSDIKLGKNAGIKTCWFRHEGASDNGVNPDMVITDFSKVKI